MTSEKPVLKPAFWQHLAANNPIGMPLTEQDVRDWFDLKWITYAEHDYTRHRKAIASWWSRVREEEILQARERAERVRDEAAVASFVARFESAADDLSTLPPADSLHDFFGGE